MSDLISRQAAIDAISVINDSICEQQAIDALCELPSAERKGKWEVYEVANTEEEQPIAWKCPNCEEVVEARYNFCPECGLDMRGEEDEDR